jgi:2-desacetyl-2-hydroxyethyl bacteriochlorophyllide A dehydrogenase
VRIAALDGPRRFVIEEVDVPTVAPDEVLVRVSACGVCASELEPWLEGPGPDGRRHPGHEVSGVVAEAGSEVSDLDVGDRVGVWVTERGYAEYVAVKADRCRPAGDGPLEEALAEPLACAANAVELADVRLADDVVVVGAGFMGNLVQKLVALRGVRTLVVADTRPDALERAAAMGATRVVDVTRESLPDVVKDLTGGRGADVAFECTGTQAALSGIGDVVRMSGKLAVVGFHQGAAREVPMAFWNWMAFTIVNGHFRELSTIMRGMTIGMRLLESGVLSMEGMVSHRYSLDEINEAFRALEEKPPGFVKAVVTF